MTIEQKESGSWRWDLKFADWPKRQRATFKTEAEAIAHDLKTKADHAAGRPYQAPTHTNSVAARAQTISDLVEHCWKVQWSTQKSAKAPRDRRWQRHPQHRNAELFADWCGPKMPASECLTYAKVTEYMVHRREAKRNCPQTLEHHWAAISVLLDAAIGMGLVEGRFRLPKQRRGVVHRERYFTPEEEQEILATCLKLGAEDYHDLFIVLAETAIRPPKEIKMIPWADIAPTRITVHASIAKNGKTRKLPCSPRAREALERVKERHPDAPGPFDWLHDERLHTFWGLLRERIAWLDERCVPYTYRHTGCTRWANSRVLARQGITAAQIAAWCGHSLTMHQRYVHPVDDADDYAALAASLQTAKVLPFAA
jgi:integrase